jgi:X-X-X-Leu-X-X-Gly heptad repeat protein
MNGAVGKTKSIKAKVSGFAIKKFFQIMPCNKPGENYTSKQLAMRKIKEIVKLPFKKISKSAPVKMIKSAWNKSKNYGKRIYSKLRDKLKEKFGKVKKFAGKAKKFAGKATNFLKKKFSGLKGGTKKVLSKGKSVAKSAYNKAKSGVKKVSSGVKKVASGVKKVASGAKNVVSKGWSKIKSIF